MKRILTTGWLAAGLLGCGRQPIATETAVSAVPVPVAAEARPIARPAAALVHPVDYTKAPAYQAGPADALIRVGARRYRLRLRAETDSTRPVDYAPAQLVGNGFAAPSDPAFTARRVRGYEGRFVFTLCDSAGRTTVFQQRLPKSAFYESVPRDVVVVSPTTRPMYLGYSAALAALVFVVELVIDASDVGYQATVLLDPATGHVKHLGPGHNAYSAAADCNPQLSPSGRAVLTCTELLRAGRPARSLTKPHATLMGARFLTDTTLLTVYEYGDYRPVPDEAGEPGNYELVVPPALRRAPNAFVTALSGRVLRAFRAGWAPGLASSMPRYFVPATRTYYFLEDAGLYFIRQARPDSVVKLPFKSLPKFTAPRHPVEAVDTLATEVATYVLYTDTLHPRRVRYRRL